MQPMHSSTRVKISLLSRPSCQVCSTTSYQPDSLWKSHSLRKLTTQHNSFPPQNSLADGERSRVLSCNAVSLPCLRVHSYTLVHLLSNQTEVKADLHGPIFLQAQVAIFLDQSYACNTEWICCLTRCKPSAFHQESIAGFSMADRSSVLMQSYPVAFQLCSLCTGTYQLGGQKQTAEKVV